MKAKVIASGKIGRDAKSKALPNERGVIEFDIASNSYYKDRQSGESRESTQWHHIKIFVNDIKDSFVDKLKTGITVTLVGNLMYDQWEKDELKRTSAYIETKSKDIDILS